MSVEPQSIPADTAPGESAETTGRDLATASQTTLVMRAFRKHKLAMAGAIITILLYLVAIFAEFLAPFPTGQANQHYPYAPPQRIHIVDHSHGHWDWGLFVYDYKSTMNPHSFAISYTVDKSRKVPLQLFPTSGPEYRMWGLIPMHLRLIGPSDPHRPMYLLGSDSSGRDLLSRLIYGTRVSMSIGLVGVVLAFALGLVLGGISGYFGGKTDMFLQRLVEFFMSIPTLPLWLGLAAAVPSGWGPLTRYFAITVILATFAWTNMARVTRGRFMSLRQEDFITSARLDGNRPRRLIFRHMLPSFTSYLIASLTLSIPGMILAETSLSFLGMGLQAPVVSWGVLLQAAQNVRVVATAPWLLLPGLVVVIAVLALNFVGDGLRDAADPYKR